MESPLSKKYVCMSVYINMCVYIYDIYVHIQFAIYRRRTSCMSEFLHIPAVLKLLAHLEQAIIPV